MLMLTRKAK
ncbi:hypothetical protein DBO95_12955 [Yersinia pestis]|nr:hypothetical protein DBO95_12955 [Yersinia pestis]